MSGAPGEEIGSNVVFVGNIPYTASEEQLQEVFETVGVVISFRSVASPPLSWRFEGGEDLVWRARQSRCSTGCRARAAKIPCLRRPYRPHHRRGCWFGLSWF